MQLIALSKGKFAKVDDEDYEWLSQWRWYANEQCPGRFYAERCYMGDDGRKVHPKMHRVIMGAPSNALVDHRDGDSLNNQRYNLRVCTKSQNLCNRSATRSNTSGYKGVFKQGEKYWMARISVGGRAIYLGNFNTPEAAAHAYDAAAIKYHGEFARLNFPR
jgi:hypothetical protein